MSRTCTYDDMNLCASWYPVLIVDEDGSFFSPPSLAFVFVISAWDPRARAGAGAGTASTDDEEPEALLPLAGRFFFDFPGGVVTARIRRKKKTINQNQPS